MMGCRYSSQRTPWWGGYGGCRQDDLASTYVVKSRPRAVFANEQFLRPVAGYTSDSYVEALRGRSHQPHDNPSTKKRRLTNPFIDTSSRSEESGHKIYVIAGLISWQPFSSKRIRIGPRRDYFFFPHPSSLVLFP